MKWIDDMSEKVKHTIRTWLQVQKSSPYTIQINELADFELNAIRNRIWYRGDGNELEQLYGQCQEYADKFKFWASKCTPGMEIRKIHTGLPGLMVKILADIVLSDMSDFEFENERQKSLWKDITKDNAFEEPLKEAIKEALAVGDGAFRISIDTSLSPYPIIEWVGAENVELVHRRGRLQEVVFKTPYEGGYVLCEHYGRGYITNKLYKGDNEVDIAVCEDTRELKSWSFDKTLILAVPFRVYENAKFKGRGGSVFDRKLDAFDSLDEIWSQWMDAMRAGRVKTYIPESLIPRDPNTGDLLKPNSFDNRYIASGDDMAENGKNTITTEQPIIPHDSYLAAYITALDLCLQGIISPSTLGIDVKKLDNSEAQREKEKTTLYTRDAIIKALRDTLPGLIGSCINALNLLNKQAVEDVKVSIPFGEYANPSFESQVETVGKGKTQGIMSIEACVEELYGDSKEQSWKDEEVKRLKAEQGIAEVEEQAVNTELGAFSV